MRLPERTGLLDRRALVVVGSAVLGAATVLVTSRWVHVVHPDYLIARRAAGTLLSSHVLDTYARNPWAQMGPLAIALARLPHVAYDVMVAALVGVVAPLLLVSRPNRARRSLVVVTCLVWGVAVVVPWSQLAWKGHADDALVLLGTAFVLLGRLRGSLPWQVGGAAVGLLGKPTALVLVVALLPSLPALALGVVAVVAIWAPFLLHNPSAMLRVGQGVMVVVRGSVLDWMGVPLKAHPPTWWRLLQSAGAVVAVPLSFARDRVAEGILLAFAVRAFLDVNPAPAYVIPLVVLALVPDVTLGLPVFTLLSTVAFYQAQTALDGGPSWPHLAALGLIVMLALVALVVPHDARPRVLAPRSPGQPVEPRASTAEPTLSPAGSGGAA